MEVKIGNERLLLKVDEAAAMLSMGRAKAYQMAQRGEFPGVVRVGRSVRVNAAALRIWVENQTALQGGNVAS